MIDRQKIAINIHCTGKILDFFFFFFFLAALGLCCCAQAFSSCGKWGLLFAAVRRLLIAEHGL